VAARLRLGERAAKLAEVEGEEIERDHLRREGLGRGDADLGPACVRIVPSDSRVIIDRARCTRPEPRAALLRAAQGRDGVGRLARLRDDDEQGLSLMTGSR
jgi:hypothetical protein